MNQGFHGWPQGALPLHLTKLQLNYYPNVDLLNGAALTANTWLDLCSNQTFTIDAATSIVFIAVSGNCWGTGYSAASVLASRILIDSAGTSISKQTGGNYHAPNTYTNLLGGSSIIALNGLTAGSHTIKVQIMSNGGDALTTHGAGVAYCRCLSNGAFESLSLVLWEVKQ